MGLTIGLVVGFMAEAFGMFGQMVSLHSGHSFASTIDPTTQADSGLIVVLWPNRSLDSYSSRSVCIVRSFGYSREAWRLTRPARLLFLRPAVDGVIRLGATVFTTGLRLAFPVIGLLLMVDSALALLGRINSQLQLNSLCLSRQDTGDSRHPRRTLGAASRVYQDYAMRLLEAIPALIGT